MNRDANCPSDSGLAPGLRADSTMRNGTPARRTSNIVRHVRKRWREFQRRKTPSPPKSVVKGRVNRLSVMISGQLWHFDRRVIRPIPMHRHGFGTGRSQMWPTTRWWEQTSDSTASSKRSVREAWAACTAPSTPDCRKSSP